MHHSKEADLQTFLKNFANFSCWTVWMNSVCVGIDDSNLNWDTVQVFASVTNIFASVYHEDWDWERSSGVDRELSDVNNALHTTGLRTDGHKELVYNI